MLSLAKLSLPAPTAAIIAMVTFGTPLKAYADVTWMLSGVTYIDGGTSTGNFVIDDSGNLESWDISSTGGSFGDLSYVSADGSDLLGVDRGGNNITDGFTLQTTGGTFELSLNFFDELSAADAADPGTEAIISGGEYDPNLEGVSRNVIAGEAVADVPEPMSVGLLGTGLIGLLVGRHRLA